MCEVQIDVIFFPNKNRIEIIAVSVGPKTCKTKCIKYVLNTVEQNNFADWDLKRDSLIKFLSN